MDLVTDKFAILEDHPYTINGSSRYKLDRMSRMRESGAARQLMPCIIGVPGQYFAGRDILWKTQVANR